MGSASSPPAQGSRGKMVFSNTFLFLPPLPALRVKRLSHFLQFTQPAFRQLPVFYGQLYTSFLHFHYRASFLRFATSLNNVRFVASVSLSAHHSPPAAHNFCVPFGLLRLWVCHTFCKEKKKQKDTPNPSVIRCCPTHSVLSGQPLSKRTPPSSVSNSIGFIPARFAFGGQVCHLGSTAFFGSELFLPKTEERKNNGISIFFFLAPLFWRGAGGEVFLCFFLSLCLCGRVF